MDEAARAQIVSILDDVSDMTIATVREDGYPQATIVSFANDGLTIYFGTAANSQKARNIARSNKVSLTVSRGYKARSEIEGLSVAGLATLVSDPFEEQKIGGLLIEKFPQIPDFLPPNQGKIALFRIEPEVISLIDYSKGFGHSELIKV